jgi:hypothetical protein
MDAAFVAKAVFCKADEGRNYVAEKASIAMQLARREGIGWSAIIDITNFNPARS